MVLLKFTGRLNMYLIMTLLSMISILLFFAIPPVQKVKQTTSLEEHQAPAGEQAESIPVSIKKFFSIFKVDSIQQIMYYMGLTGITSAITVGFMHVLVEKSLYKANPLITDNKINIITTFTFLSISLSAIICGIVVGKAIDKFNNSLILFASGLGDLV